MSLTGLFLIIFLAVHLAGNLQLLAGDGGACAGSGCGMLLLCLWMKWRAVTAIDDVM